MTQQNFVVIESSTDGSNWACASLADQKHCLSESSGQALFREKAGWVGARAVD